MLDRLNDLMTNVYMLFLHSVLPIIDSFTGLLECEEPMIHKDGECINTWLARELLGRFIKLQYIRDAESLLDIDYTNPGVQLSNHQLSSGFRNYTVY